LLPYSQKFPEKETQLLPPADANEDSAFPLCPFLSTTVCHQAYKSLRNYEKKTSKIILGDAEKPSTIRENLLRKNGTLWCERKCGKNKCFICIIVAFDKEYLNRPDNNCFLVILNVL